MSEPLRSTLPDDAESHESEVLALDVGAGTPLELSSTTDSELLVRAQGALFLVTDRFGNVAPRGAKELGLFFRDTRFLSHYRLNVRGVELVLLSSERSNDAFNQIDLMMAAPDEGAFLDDPQHYFHLRRRQLLDDEFVEEIAVTSYIGRVAVLELELEFDADFADIFETRGAKRVRRGVSLAPEQREDALILNYRGRDGVEYGSELRFSPPPNELGPRTARFEVALAPGETREFQVTVAPLQRELEVRHARHAFSARCELASEGVASFRGASTQVRCSNGGIQRVLDQSISDLAHLRVPMADGQILAAGIPWFCAPFGRDSLIASYQTLLVQPTLAKDTLRALAAFQGTRFDEETEEEPGKIFHELRFGEMANSREIPHRPYYGTIDATPLFVVVADATYKVTGDDEWLKEIAPAVLAALRWIDARSENGTRFVSYEKSSERGLDNQGWKDSRAAVAFPDGSFATPPVALCEIQGYCADAYARGARLLRALGDGALAATYAGRAESLRALFNERFWLAEHGRYAYALDGEERLLPTVVSNVGHLLWSRVADETRARATADLLLRRESFSGYGVRTLAAEQAAYNPLSYHNGTVWPHDNSLIAKGMANYGLTGHATALFEGMVSAMQHFHDHRLPELFCGMPREAGNLVRYPVACSPQAWATGAPFLFLQAVLGIHADAPSRTLSIRNASLPPSVEWCELDNLRIGQSRVRVRLRRSGQRVHLEQLEVTGAHLRTEVEHS